MADCILFFFAQVPSWAWLEQIARFDQPLLHFAIALLGVAGLAELWRAVRRDGMASRAASVCMGFGTLCVALLAARGAQREYESLRGGVVTASTGLALLIVFIAAVSLTALAVQRRRGGRVAVYRTGAVLCAMLVVLAGYVSVTQRTPGSAYFVKLSPLATSSNVISVAAVEPTPAGDISKSIHHLSQLPLPTGFPADGTIDFIRDVQPILAHACYECHGPAKRRGALRLDNKKMTFDGGNGGPAVVAGNSADSYLIQRVLGQGNEKRMPMGKPPLPDYQVKILRAWIDQGATWPDHASNEHGEEETHWAYVPPVRHPLPKVKNQSWPRNGIDHFVLARLEKEGLEPSPEGDRATLIRRVSLDLVGLPPTPEEVDAFAADDSLDAYDKLVNRLLASPHYGEKWGRHWLDVARYADTNGYEKDNPRTIWPYRDWVIDAINRDVTYDQFVIQQIAGDMLPNASIEDRIATGFHRNTMYNEEGGIDVEEFRYKAIVDRVQTTSTAFLGLTMHCAQCHNHKYDAISHKEYFEFFSMLNNADEPKLEIPRPDITAQREVIAAKIAAAEARLEKEFPLRDEALEWEVLEPTSLRPNGAGVVLTKQPDHSILAAGPVPEKESYTIHAKVDLTGATALRLEVLTDPSLPKNGPGRSDGGNFVLSELQLARIGSAKRPKPEPIPLSGAQADFSQQGFDVASAIDGSYFTGWAIATADGAEMDRNRTATFRFAAAQPPGPTTLRLIIQHHYPRHPLGRFRFSIGRPKPDSDDATMGEDERRAKYLAAKLAEWEASVAAKAVKWTVLDPKTFRRNHDGTITKLPDRSLLFTGDNLYRDEYELGFDTDVKDITGIRLETLPDEYHPKNGPGRSHVGGFLLSGITVSAAPAAKADGAEAQPVPLVRASADISPDTVARAIDDQKNSHWTVGTGDGRPHAAVFQLKAPLAGHAGGTRLNIKLLQNYHQSENIGRLRISVTTDPRAALEAAGVPAEIEAIVLTPAAQRTVAQSRLLKQHFLLTTPLLTTQHQAIAALKASMPAHQTTLVMTERSVPRVTRIMHRGEFLQPKEQVGPGVPAVLHPLPEGPKDRMALARWLVAPDNPLIGRVTMNRVWATYFGRGIVNTVEDFGIMGEKPSHPELLDWLATEFVRQNWSMKAMHRLIVTSATYRQSSRLTPQLLEKDPANVLLARGARMRVPAETVRDIVLAASGLLSGTIGGPSVYPPQPAGVSELSYGAMAWPTSEGPDRYRRGLYTYLKRTSPYPGLTVFDGPTSEVTCTVRIRSNTPLQALTMLNDTVFVEAAQALGRRVVEEVQSASSDERIRRLFRLCVARAPEPGEMAKIKTFYERQLKRFREKQADPAKVALRDPKRVPPGMDVPEVAAWTMVARAVMNLDETVTKE